MTTNGDFSALNPQATIFKELRKQQPGWWSLLSGDKELYIDIRKDNYISVYYFGGSLAKISYKNGFLAETHQKYLGHTYPLVKTKAGVGKFIYIKNDLAKLDIKVIADIKRRIQDDYLHHIEDEYPAEKWIQGKIITQDSKYIDSEFQFNKDDEINNLRIDLIELSDGLLSFVELKGISDSRLRIDEKRNTKTPEIIDQMKKYKEFIRKYESEIDSHYRKLIEIKQGLGLLANGKIVFSINKTPKLLIVNTYKRKTKNRSARIADIKKLLDSHKIDYKITT